MRRFDKKSVIREANQRLEKEFLTKKLSLSEQDASSGTNVKPTVERKVTKNSDSTYKVDITIKKNKITGFAKYYDTIPKGFTATVGEKDGSEGSFVPGTGMLKFIWTSIPDKEILNMSYTLQKTTDSDENPSITGGEFKYFILGGNETDAVKIDPTPLEETSTATNSGTSNSETDNSGTSNGKNDKSDASGGGGQVTEKQKKTFNMFKKDYKLDGDDQQASGVIPGSEGNFDIKINVNGTYTITNSENKEVQSGKYESKGLLGTGMGKHIELTPNTNQDVQYKMSTILSGLNKTSSTKPTGLYNNLVSNRNISNENNIKALDNGKVIYVFKSNKTKNGGATYSVIFTPDSKETSKGIFKLAAKLPTDETSKWIKNSEGTFEQNGKKLMLTNPPTKGSLDTKGTIDTALINFLSKAFPEYETYGSEN